MSDMKHTLSLCLAAFALAACTGVARRGVPHHHSLRTGGRSLAADPHNGNIRWYGEYLERAKPRHGNRKSDGRRK